MTTQSRSTQSIAKTAEVEGGPRKTLVTRPTGSIQTLENRWRATRRDKNAVLLLVAALVAGGLLLQGCATQWTQRPPGLEQKIVNAHSRGDHDELAVIYEQQAEADRAVAKEHETRARTYRREPRYRGLNLSMAQHCEAIAREYRQAAEENAALAKLHREIAKEAQH